MTCLDRWQHLPRICLALVPLFACLFAAEVQDLVLAQGSKTDYHIYVGASAAPAERRVVRREVHVAEAATAYKLFELPGTWRQDTARSIGVAPPGSGAIQALYVDRVIAIRQ